MKKLLFYLLLAVSLSLTAAPTNPKQDIWNGHLKNDLDAEGHTIINLNLPGITLPDTVIPGTYNNANITLDSKGRATAVSSGTIISLLGTPEIRGIKSTAYFAVRGDNKLGSGSPEDPYNAGGASQVAKAAALDSSLRILPPQTHIVFLGGSAAVLFTDGQDYGDNVHGFNVKEGWWISGGGATLRLARTPGTWAGGGATGGEKWGVVAGGVAGVAIHNVFIEDLTIDANWGITGETGTIESPGLDHAIGCLSLAGSHITVKNVTSINTYGYGPTGNEGFAMVFQVVDPRYGHGEISTDNWFIDCLAMSPKKAAATANSYNNAFLIFGLNLDQVPSSGDWPITNSGCINCRAYGDFGNSGFGSAWSHDAKFINCTAVVTGFGWYDDTGYNYDTIISNCHLESGNLRGLMFNGSPWPNDSIVIKNNVIRVTGANAGGGIALDGSSHAHATIMGNEIYSRPGTANEQSGIEVAGGVLNDINITKNFVHTGAHGIYVSQAASNLDIDSNILDSALLDGIRLGPPNTPGQGVNRTIKNNKITLATGRYGIVIQDSVPTGVVIKDNDIYGPAAYGMHLGGSGGHFITNNVIDCLTPFAGTGAANVEHFNYKRDGTVVGTPTPLTFDEGGTATKNGTTAFTTAATSGTVTIPAGIKIATSTSTSTNPTLKLPVIGPNHPPGWEILISNSTAGALLPVIDSANSSVGSVTYSGATRFVPMIAPSTWKAIPSNTFPAIYNGVNNTLTAPTQITAYSAARFTIQSPFGGPIFVATDDGVSVAKLSFFGHAASGKQTGNILTALTNYGLMNSPTIAIGDVTGLGTVASRNTGTSSGQVPLIGVSGQLDPAVLPTGSLTFKGTWNATTNTPTLADGSGTSGWQYRAAVAGTQNLGSGSLTWAVGDDVIYNGTIWLKSPSAGNAVTSVAGRTGAVTINRADIADATASGRQVMGITSSGEIVVLELDASGNATTHSIGDLKNELELGSVDDTADAVKYVLGASTLINASASIAALGDDHILFDAAVAYDFGSGQAALFRTGLGLGTMALQANTGSSTTLQKGNGTGGLAPAAAGADYVGATSGSAIQKANGSGGLAPATAGTDYIGPTSGAAVQKGNGSGGLTAAAGGVDFQPPPVSNTVSFSTPLAPVIGISGARIIYKIGALTNNITLSAPTGGTPSDGQTLELRFTQDATGGRTVTWNSAYVFGTDITAAMEPVAANASWRRLFEYNNATSKWECVGLVRGF